MKLDDNYSINKVNTSGKSNLCKSCTKIKSNYYYKKSLDKETLDSIKSKLNDRLLKGEVKECSICNLSMSIDNFSINRKNSNNLTAECKKCLVSRINGNFKKKEIIDYSIIDYDKTKVCTKCDISIKLVNYSKNIRSKGGFSSICKCCDNKRNIIKRDIRNKDIQLKIKEMYDDETMITCCGCNEEKSYTSFNINSSNKSYLDSKCKSCKSEFNKSYRKNNNVKLNKLSREYSKNNRDGINKTRKKRIKDDPQFRMRINISNRLRKIFKSKGAVKKCPVKDALGCSYNELMLHIKSLFQDGMSWENYGVHGWHLDHIKPLSSFDLTVLDEYKQANHYTNLQPLWAEDNLRKGAKLDYKVNKT